MYTAGLTLFIIFAIGASIWTKRKYPNAKSSISNIVFLGLLLSFSSLTLFVYEIKFGIDLNNTRDFEQWESVAVYLNNMLQPILLSASIFLLYKTWQTSETELRETRKVLNSQTELLLFDKLTENLKYFTEPLLKKLNSRIDIDNGYLKQYVDELVELGKFESSSCFWPTDSYHESELIHTMGGEDKVNLLNGVVEPPTFGYEIATISLSSVLPNSTQEQYSEVLGALRLSGNRIAMYSLLSNNEIVAPIDKVILSLIRYISTIQTKELQLIILKKLKEVTSSTSSFELLLSFYKTRLLTSREVNASDELKNTVCYLYDSGVFEIRCINDELLETINLKLDPM
ncbi:hypothetical protein HUZ36_05110 [Pseudoalteromonas sp. McH1-7]|uniref:hypothetical protein n=1 Tax=Pseudoalteromonas sp. McH1-7 TaxID=2745574 RepID=UPI001591EB53|nr:hypothetical protein [Pseudoalteromonas sp. McH1-7]NUZ10153.1 hypothetical protein [Pseudoalteromonas sp. McH1-7]